MELIWAAVSPSRVIFGLVRLPPSISAWALMVMELIERASRWRTPVDPVPLPATATMVASLLASTSREAAAFTWPEIDAVALSLIVLDESEPPAATPSAPWPPTAMAVMLGLAVASTWMSGALAVESSTWR